MISIERDGFRPTRIPLHARNTSVVFICLHFGTSRGWKNAMGFLPLLVRCSRSAYVCKRIRGCLYQLTLCSRERDSSVGSRVSTECETGRKRIAILASFDCCRLAVSFYSPFTSPFSVRHSQRKQDASGGNGTHPDPATTSRLAPRDNLPPSRRDM